MPQKPGVGRRPSKKKKNGQAREKCVKTQIEKP